MLSQQVFILSEVDGLAAESLQTLDGVQATKLIQEGKAVEAPTPELNSLQREIDKAVQTFRDKVKKLQASDDPVHRVEGAQEYYVNQYKQELDAKVADLEAQYEAISNEIKEEARRDLANNIENVPSDERAKATDIINEAVVSLKFGNDIGALDMLLENLPYYSGYRKLALLRELPKLSEIASGHMHEKAIESRLKRLYHELNEVRQARLIPIKVAKAIPSRGDGSYRILRQTHPAYKK
jgi:chromosome segregation ATPase